ncbi:DUF2510 domain-containing protein [Rhodococcus qingshengii]|uniref:DUF2510 domain-containing protein n=1 Tax=Rhodococcus TaxID=1827 RepID=UPI00097696CE|nr:MULTISPECIES: DUF2510 domain-containing protein [Rhodococcus]AUS31669.1 DUF2510 domain-containing protein [Rhodococcus qingshengii]MCC4304188.1 DUF2510 domain-containing protein [Rhodococcus sp. 3-2]
MSTPPAGWHPDPEGNQQLRYWDGQQWTSATQPMPTPQTPTPETPEQAKDRKRQLIAIGIIIAAVASIAIFKSIDFSSDDTETAAAETTTTQATPTTTSRLTTTATIAATTPRTTTSAAPTSTTLPVAAQTSKPLPTTCKVPAQSVIDQIDASFIEADRHLEDVYMVYGRKDVAYIGANIMDSAGTRVSSADIWAQSDGMLFSLSSDARRRTALPDGRKLLDISAGDEFGSAVSDCIMVSVINRNVTGGN